MKKISFIFKLLTKADLVIISLILLSALISLLYSTLYLKEKTEVSINLNNEFYAAFPLNKDKIIYIESLATVEIKDNKASISFSTCKNQNCVIQGWSNKQPILCVPNKILLQFSSDKKNEKDRIFITL